MSAIIDYKRKTLVISLPKSLGGRKTTRGLAGLPEHAWEPVKDAINAYMKTLRIRAKGTAAHGLDHWRQVSDFIDDQFLRVLQVSYNLPPNGLVMPQALVMQQQGMIDGLQSLQALQMANAPLMVSSAVEKAIEASAPTIGELCQRYINEKEQGQYSEKTKQTTRLYFHQETGYIFKGTRKCPTPLVNQGDSILSIDRGMLIDWISTVWADISEKSKETYIVNLASFFNWIETTQNIKGYVNPATSLMTKGGTAATVTVSEESKRWTDEELSLILKATTDDDAASWLIRIMAYTGLRIDETAQLLKKDITLRTCANDGSRYFAVSVDISEDDKDYKKLKTNAAKRTVYLGFPDAQIDAFIAWMDRQTDERVFSELVRDKVSGYTNSAGRKTKEIYLALKKHLTPKNRPNHAFRHAFNDRCYKAKMPLRMEKRVLGHSLGKDMTIGTYAEDHEHDEVFMTLRDAGVWRNLL